MEKGKRQTVWLPEKLNEKAEEVRQKLGLSKSGFYRFAIVEIIKQYQTKQLKRKVSA
jgi:metal-responsive CopG/Arc/MetJ family transcriptional regulator